MSNDLISRSAVLNIIKPRLDSARNGSLEQQRLYSILASIVQVPAVYDVDKIVYQLEDMLLKREEQLMNCADNKEADCIRCRMLGIAEAIKIVKAEKKE